MSSARLSVFGLASGETLRAPTAAVLFAFMLGSSRVFGQDVAGVCADDAERGQVVRDAGKLVDARQLFVACSHEHCPAAVRNACVGWLLDVDERVPTLVFTAKDAADHDLVDVLVSIDGRKVASELSGARIRVDPGRHVVRFEHPGAPAVEQVIVASEGERGRIVQAHFRDQTAPGPQNGSPARLPAPWSIPRSVYPVAGVAALGFGLFTYFGIAGANDYGDLRDRCGSHCASTDVDGVRVKFAVADVALGVGIAALATMTVVLVASRPRRSPGPATMSSRPGSAWLQVAF